MFTAGEWFLLTWAGGATVLAVWFQHRLARLRRATLVQHAILVGFMHGTTVMTKRSNGATFTNITEEEHNEIRIEARQG